MHNATNVILLALLVLFCARHPSAFAGNIDSISRCVAFIKDAIPVTEDVDGAHFEVWLRRPGDTNQALPKLTRITGSGLVVASSNLCYLVTAKHVATRLSPNCEIILGGDNREPLRFKISQITGQQSVTWFHHATADISVHPLPSVTSEGRIALTRRAVPIQILDSGTNAPSRDIHVIALGFPLGLGAEGEFVPLSRESKVSSGILREGPTTFFLLQDPGVSGYSGGPILESGDPQWIGGTLVAGHPHCWGFVSATFGDETGGKMCRVTPAIYACQLIREIEATIRVVQVPGGP